MTPEMLRLITDLMIILAIFALAISHLYTVRLIRLLGRRLDIFATYVGLREPEGPEDADS